ncbi:MAG: hypothetical protein AAF664_19155, partial [Planctomycetota bacterium]
MSIINLRTCTAILVLPLLSGFAIAQSGTRRAPQPQYRQAPVYSTPSYSAPTTQRQGSVTRPSASTASPSGSGTTSATKSVGLDGYCPVCIIEMKQWVKGKPEYQVTYDGHVYHFPGEEQRQTFLKNPAKYVPAMGGNCIVCAVNMKQKVPGSVMHTALYRGRLYLFPGADQTEMFRKNPAKYASADVALGGNCSVCRVEMD